MRWSTIGVMALLTVLAGTTAYYVSKSVALQDQLGRKSPTPTSSSTATTSTTASAIPTLSTSPSAQSTSTTSSENVNLATGDRLPTPAETYAVVAGDTLYPIGLKLGMAWERIAETNNLTEPYLLQIGQTLIIPTVDAKANLYSVKFSSDPTRARDFQSKADQGKDSWRLTPATVAKTENWSVFGLASSDDYRETAKDDTAGTAKVLATRLVDGATKSYEVNLIQPASKGATGIWTIESIVVK